MTPHSKVYVASSWGNKIQPVLVPALRELGWDVYDFRHPAPDNDGFHWSAIDKDWEKWSELEYLLALQHPIAKAGYKLDWEAMQEADVGIMVLPCGRSAHLEAGYFVGAGKPLYIVMGDEDPVVPELMYKMSHAIFPGIASLLEFLRSPEGQPGISVPEEENVKELTEELRSKIRGGASFQLNGLDAQSLRELLRKYNGHHYDGETKYRVVEPLLRAGLVEECGPGMGLDDRYTKLGREVYALLFSGSGQG